MNLSKFAFEGYPIRVLVINSEPWFVAKEVCDALGIANSRQALTRLDDDEKDTVTLNDGIAGNPNKAIVSESGLYALVLSSKKESGAPFRRWVRKEVLPSIRKTGSYTLDQQSSDDLRLSVTQVRKQTLNALHSAGLAVKEHHYINMTNAAYVGLFGMGAVKLRKERGWPEGCNVRERLTDMELCLVRTVEWALYENLTRLEFSRSSEVNTYIKRVAAEARSVLNAAAEPKQITG
jgi:prophage antirepressor-like protein